jgi:hypothetical protein
MLSQSHPLYISHIRATVAITKGGSDKALIFLSAVSIGVLCIQTLIGMSLPRRETCGLMSEKVYVPSTSMFRIILLMGGDS